MGYICVPCLELYTICFQRSGHTPELDNNVSNDLILKYPASLTILPFTFNYHIREVPDHTLEHIYKFIASLIESEQPKEKRACRGPFLAQLELGKLCKQQCIYSDSRLSKLLQYVMYLHYLMYLINDNLLTRV